MPSSPGVDAQLTKRDNINHFSLQVGDGFGHHFHCVSIVHVPHAQHRRVQICALVSVQTYT